MKKNNKIILIILVFIAVVVSIIGISYSEPIFNNEEILPDSELIYYLNIYYDGVDKNGIKSSDTTVSSVNSGYMLVEDKLPNGLTFDSFVTTSDGTIGAVTREGNSSCVGSVYDDTKESKVDSGTWNSDNSEYYYHGLHYDVASRTVSFKVKDLQAGCKITVGIKTITPNDVDDSNTVVTERRRDFFNFALAREDASTILSNIAHVYMGDVAVKLYSVNYSYTGNVPVNAPQPPTDFKYALNDIISVMMPMEVEGYTFSGWTTNDVTVQDGVFAIPNHDVNFTGSFTENNKYKVKYIVDGDIPSGYIIPDETLYYENHNVVIDNPKMNNYSFSGWTSTDLDLTSDDNSFMMPNHDVTLHGTFTEKEYTITYAFYDTIVPENANTLLPQTQSYKAGDVVSLPTINDVSGYKFVGWNKESNFVMPNNNLTIYGLWEHNNGTFEPTISIEIVDPKDNYKAGDTIKYKINVKNENEFPLTEVIVKEILLKASFINGEGYEVQSNRYARIPSLASGSTKELYAIYVVQDSDNNEIVNEVTVVGGLSNNNKQLLKSSASTNFNIVSNIIVHHYLLDSTTKVYEDEISEVNYGSAYSTSSKKSSEFFDAYKNRYEVVSDSSNTSGVVSSSSVEVTYYYGIDMFHINVKVIGGVGTITGSELVAGGNSSKEDIIIEPSQGYEIKKILVNGNEIAITNKDKMILDKFENVREDKNIEVEFVEKDQIAPITGIAIKIYIISVIIMALAASMYLMYRKMKGEVL